LDIEVVEPFRSKIIQFGDLLIDPYNISTKGRVNTTIINVSSNLETSNVDDIATAVNNFTPIRVMFGMTKISGLQFSGGSSEELIKVEVYSMVINKIRNLLRTALSLTTQQESAPHVKLCYVKPNTGLQYVGHNPFIGMKMIVDNMTFTTIDKKYKLFSNGNIEIIE